MLDRLGLHFFVVCNIVICKRKHLEFSVLEGLLLNLQKVNILICAMCTTHRLISADIRRCFCGKEAELCPWVCQKPELGVKYKRCKNRGGLRPDGNIPLKMLNLAAFVNTFRKEDDNMMNEIHEELKIMTVWLTKNESADPELRDRLTKECVENSKGYKVAVFFSGNDDLYETTSALLRYNRKRMAQMEVEKEKIAAGE